jgi:hypothetical protein
VVDIDLLIKAKAVLGTAQTEITKFLNGVEKQTEKIGKESEGVGSQIGSFFKGGFMVAAGAVTVFAGVVASATAAIVALGMKGAAIDDTRQAFAGLTRDVGGYDASLRTLRTATDGVVTDTELMMATNKAFSLGLRLNQDEMKLTGETARILADRVGIDTAQAYGVLTQAMATGRDMMLKQVGLNIDAKQSVEDYARALGKEASELNESEQILAKRNAIIAAMRTELETTGRAEIDFADRVDQVKTALQNFNDNIAAAIATSPVVNEMLGSIGDAFMGAFGNNQQQAVQTIIGYVNKFAIFLVDVAKLAVDTGAVLTRVFEGVKTVVYGLATVLGGVFTVIGGAVTGLLKLATYLPQVGDSFKGMADAAYEWTKTTAESTKEAAALTAASARATVQGNAFTAGLNDMSAGLTAMRGRMVEAGKAQVDSGKIADALVGKNRTLAKSHAEVNKTLDDTVKRIRQMTQAADMAAKNGALEAWARANSGALQKLAIDAQVAGRTLEGSLKAALLSNMQAAGSEVAAKEFTRIVKEQQDQVAKSVEAMNEKYVRGLEIRAEALREASDSEHRVALDDLSYKEFLLGQERDAKAAELQSLGQATEENLSAVQQTYARKMFEARVAHDKEVEKMKASQNSFANMVKKWTATIPQLIVQAFTGGGGLSGALKGIGSMMGGDILSNLFTGADGKGGLAAWVTKSLGGKLGKSLGGLVGGLGGPLGSLLGSLVGDLAGKALGKVGGFFKGLFGGDSKETKQIKETSKQLTELYGGIENIRLLSKATGVDMEAAFKGKGKAGLEALTKSAEQFKAKLEELKTKFAEWAGEALEAHVKLPASMTPYLAQLEKLGLLTSKQREELEHWSQDGVVDIEAMKAAADRYGISVAALGPAFQQGVANQNWQQVVDDIKLFESSGVDVTGVLHDMADEISGLVQDSIQFKTTIPENMRPWIEKLIESGELVDENGDKITDINKLSFGDPLIAALDKIINRFDLLLQGLGLIPRAIDNIPRRVDIDINYREGPRPRMDREAEMDGGDEPGPGGEITVPGAAAGGLFSTPTFRVVGEKEPEVVGSPSVIVQAFAEALRQVGGAQQGGGSNTVQFNLTTPLATVDTVRQMFYEEIGPIFLEWLNDNRGGSQTQVKQILGIE